MEEAETASGAAETNGVADREDAEMSQPEPNGIARSDQTQTPQQVRGHAKHSSAEHGLTRIRNHYHPSSNRQVLRLPFPMPQMLLQVPCHRLFSEQVRMRL
jgi:hypothetical protein